jgi:hypothetical protein
MSCVHPEDCRPEGDLRVNFKPSVDWFDPRPGALSEDPNSSVDSTLELARMMSHCSDVRKNISVSAPTPIHLVLVPGSMASRPVIFSLSRALSLLSAGISLSQSAPCAHQAPCALP